MAQPFHVWASGLDGAGARVSDFGGRLGSAVFDGGLERGVVAFVLVGVGFGEVGDRLVEGSGTPPSIFTVMPFPSA